MLGNGVETHVRADRRTRRIQTPDQTGERGVGIAICVRRAKGGATEKVDAPRQFLVLMEIVVGMAKTVLKVYDDNLAPAR
ncbi:hypothetical protein GWI33_010505 [Rhynchophorus ferrugineus]|uniref:Uncharacterized protein n=1 Tax=Rhynchophorus ferrugineus TaxID=354439 RepID=A0A834I8B8_RHYFE|nr:hypothetical protein GWI33_010505 [Rhynchophorus ferrugineus]